MNTLHIIDSLWVCQYCLMVLAGYGKDEVDMAEEDYDYVSGCVGRLMEREGVKHVAIDDDEEEFSRYACDCCDSGLAGRRSLVNLVGEVCDE